MSKMEFYNDAEEMFVKNGLSVDEITSQLGVSRRTIYYWMEKYKWGDRCIT